MTCNVTGTAISPNGAIKPGAKITFRRAQFDVVSQEGSFVIPDDYIIQTALDGTVDFDILPSVYVASTTAVGGRYVEFKFSVPDEPAADFADCLSAAYVDIPPASVTQAQQARDAAIAARDVAVLAAQESLVIYDELQKAVNISQRTVLATAGQTTYAVSTDGDPLGLTPLNHILIGPAPFGAMTYGVDYTVTEAGALVLAFSPRDGDLLHLFLTPRTTNEEAQQILNEFQAMVAGEADRAEAAADAAAGSAALAAIGSSYASRALAVTAATSSTWPVGAVIRDGRVSYRYAGSGTAIDDMPGWVPFGTATPLHFGATPGASGDDRPAFVAAKAFVDGIGAPLNVPAGEYRFSSALDFGNTPLLLEQGAVIVNAAGASEALVYRNGQYVSPLIYDGENSIYAVGRTERGGRTHYVNGINGTGTVAGPTIEDHTAWYDGSVDNAYSVMQQMDFNYIQYGERKKYLGQKASGTVSLYGGAINVFSVERKPGGFGRSEITPIACGLNFMPDASADPHYNLYNDYIVSGHANADPYFREGFLAGASYLVQKYTQGNWLDADHDGSYGITIATRPQSGGFAAEPHTARSWPLRAGLVVAGYSGAQSVTAGDAVGADNGFDRGILIGSGFDGEGGGSVWLPWNGRSRIGVGIHVTDTVTAGILIERVYSGYGIHVKNGGARFEAAYFALTGLPTSASGLASGQLWRDAAAGNVVKIVP